MNVSSNSFLDLQGRHAQYETADFAVLPIPYDATTSFLSGTRYGPAAIIAASHHLEDYDEELGFECHECGISTLGPVEPDAADPQAMHEKIFKRAEEIVQDGKFLFGLGGEHGVTSGLVRAVMTKHKEISVLQIDAHCDLRDTYQDSPFSHACVMRRVIEFGANVVPVGIRSISLEESQFIDQQQIDVVTARDCMTSDNWIDRVLAGLRGKVYVSIDIDGFDPAYAPGTGTPEPGGLHWYQVTGLLGLVAQEKEIVAADIVEVMPIPGQAVTENLAAKLAYKLMGYVQAGK